MSGMPGKPRALPHPKNPPPPPYTSPHLLRDSLHSSPLIQFNKWLAEASDPNAPTPVREPEAMAISTVSPSGVPSSRFVLLRGVDDRGFVFFTNYTSRKSRELAENPNIAIVFYWKEVARQVRVIGRAEKVEKEISDEYFGGRPRGSQIGAWASEQSSVIGEKTLKERVEEYEGKFGEGDVQRPEHWGGWRVIPNEVEFWAGHTSRLHDRFRYLVQPDGSWKVDRLAP
ncbi:pyridoxamine 5'-phosphate oxidase [Dioszegia hungarica]|uniref:pyridoxal 5'-phosphate synthase n=1 Tax=Dioszegia hungarica TaxID=4972 RepID=A0AA38H4E2_9TREE|nr:pyridoxamine 5'-phosphate oxidase [Dioszegia hungarica]KAI9632229.1 pyridoxamine 5'-phosphate oxidase [Dioszegia hungarica]